MTFSSEIPKTTTTMMMKKKNVSIAVEETDSSSSFSTTTTTTTVVDVVNVDTTTTTTGSDDDADDDVKPNNEDSTDKRVVSTTTTTTTTTHCGIIAATTTAAAADSQQLCPTDDCTEDVDDCNDCNWFQDTDNALVHHTDIHEKYTIEKNSLLGKGSFGVVRKCKNIQTGEQFALKTILKSKLPDPTQLRREIDILLHVDHPHIIKLYDVYEDPINIYLVNELCSGGELYDRVIEKTQSPEGHFSEYTAARIIKNILSAIQYCHDVKQIVHRDLKPENFLLTDNTDDAQVKVIDFGLSRYAVNQRMHSEVGTIYYVAPEVLSGDYTDKADIWSIGVVTYVLLCGFPPFNAGNESLTYNILADGAADVKFPSPAWDRITPEAISFIQRLLEKDPNSRLSAKEALEDTWLSHELVSGRSEQKKSNWRGTFLPKHGPEANKVPAARQVVHVEKQQQNAFHRLLNQRRNRQKQQHPKHQKQESNHNHNDSKHRGSSSSSSEGGLSTTSSMIQAPTHDNNSSSTSHRHRTKRSSRRFGNGQLIDKLFHTNISGRNNDATTSTK